MQADDIRLLFDYSYWANARVLKTAANLSYEQFIAPGAAGQGGVRDTLVHILGAEYIWRQRCQEEISPTRLPGEEDFPDLASLVVIWREEEAKMRDYLALLDDEALIGIKRYANTKGVAFENVLWQILAHVVNHGTQHRSEIAVLLTTYGRSPGDLDFIVYLREVASGQRAA